MKCAARAALIAGLLLQAACRESENEGGNAFDPATVAQTGACEERRFEGSRFTVCAYDAGRDTLRLAWRDEGKQPLRSLSALQAALGADAAQVRFAMNAGMYDKDGAPIGLFIQGGKTLKPLNLRPGPGNFHLLPNGVFAVDEEGHADVFTAEAFNNLTDRFAWATQSGPMLVIANKLHPKFDPDGQSRLIRNGVGVKDPRTAFFVISEDAVSFGRFARFFRDVLGCRDALYLDGTVSSLWDPAAERQDAYGGLGPMIFVLRKE
jgi:uncharacterized protein YigE (DUF2233 family)